MRSARSNGLTILLLVLGLYACGTSIAAKPDASKTHRKRPPVIKLVSTKMPVFNGVVFTDDDKKFHSWLTTFWPKHAQDLKAVEKDAKVYQTKFASERTTWRRLWKGYKHNVIYGQFLVKEVEFRLERIEILDKLGAAKKKDQKTKLHGDLTEIVSKEFDVAVKIKKFDYYQLRRRINRMTKGLSKHESEVKKLVQRRDAEIKKRLVDLINAENGGGSPISETVITVKPKKKVNGSTKPAVIKLKATKMPAFQGVVFTEDDMKFHSYLTTFWLDEAHDLKDIEKKAKAYQEKFNHFKSRFVRLWKGYKRNAIYGQYLVEEVKLRYKKLAILDKYTDAKTKEQKAKLLGALTDTVSKEFDISVMSKKHKYNLFRAKINKMRDDLAGREEKVKEFAKRKDQEVKLRVKDLVTGEEKINWK